MRISAVLLVLLSLTACNRGSQNKDAVRQGVIDYLNSKGLNVAGMNVELTSVQFNGNQADTTASITPKGNTGGGMSMNYHLEQQGTKWVVMGRKDTGASPHGGGMVPGATAPAGDSPHGGAAMPPSAPGSGKMPSPEDLPPTKKK